MKIYVALGVIQKYQWKLIDHSSSVSSPSATYSSAPPSFGIAEFCFLHWLDLSLLSSAYKTYPVLLCVSQTSGVHLLWWRRATHLQLTFTFPQFSPISRSSCRLYQSYCAFSHAIGFWLKEEKGRKKFELSKKCRQRRRRFRSICKCTILHSFNGWWWWSL